MVGISTSMFSGTVRCWNSRSTTSRYGESTLCAMKVSAASSVIETVLRCASRCLRRNHERQRVGVDHVGFQPLVGRIVADHAQLQVAVQQFVGDLARKAAPHLHLDLGIQLAG